MKVLLESQVSIVNALSSPGVPLRPVDVDAALSPGSLKRKRPEGPVEEWDADTTSTYLRATGFGSYGDIFDAEGYNGMMLLVIDDNHINQMPELNDVKRKCFSLFIKKLQKENNK
jgi:hypothetical protein